MNRLRCHVYGESRRRKPKTCNTCECKLAHQNNYFLSQPPFGFGFSVAFASCFPIAANFQAIFSWAALLGRIFRHQPRLYKGFAASEEKSGSMYLTQIEVKSARSSPSSKNLSVMSDDSEPPKARTEFAP